MKALAILLTTAVLSLSACKNDDRSFQPPPVDPTITVPSNPTAERRCERLLGNRDEPAFGECVATLSEPRGTTIP